ncbi:MAG: serine/threonine-protein kinase, partial [Polyangiales bacterium]
ASLVGEVLGNYRLTAELSSGGMGTVYRAEHELLGRAAAIKLLRPELSSNDVLVQRFVNEAKAATAIRHPGIIEVYDFGYTEDGRAYLVMEFLDGEPLGTRLQRRGRLTELEAAAIARGIASALKAAHAKGIIHRDLKPDNVFLVPDPDGTGDRVKVLDFGVAKLADAAPTNVRHTQTGALMGTPLYMAPEQARAAGTIDERADLYSLGCMLYEMLVGKPPFVADGAGEIIAMQLFGQVQPPTERLASLTPEMNAIVMQLLEKEPHDRFQNAAAVQQALASVAAKLSARLSAEINAAESRPQTMLPTPMPSGSPLHFSMIDGPPQQPDKRSSLPIVAAVITIVLAAAGGIFVLTRSGDDEPAKNPETTATPPSVAPPIAAPMTKAVPPEVKQVVPETKQTPASTTTPPPKKKADKTVKTTPTTKIDPGTDTSGPVTHPGMHTTEGAPIEPDLGPVKKPEPPKDP